jgi:hypothetical protein
MAQNNGGEGVDFDEWYEQCFECSVDSAPAVLGEDEQERLDRVQLHEQALKDEQSKLQQLFLACSAESKERAEYLTELAALVQRVRETEVWSRQEKILPASTCVVIHSLVTRGYNGKLGSTVGYDTAKGRYHIKLEESGTSVALRPANFQVLQAEPPVTQDANTTRHSGLAAQGRDVFVGITQQMQQRDLELTIEHGSSLIFRLHVPPPACEVSWEFTSLHHSVGYGSMFISTNELPVLGNKLPSTSRVNSHKKAVGGRTSNSTGGQLVIKFDNSFSSCKNKTVKLQLRSGQELVWSHFGKRKTAMSTVNGGAMAAFAVPTVIAAAVAGPFIAGAVAARGAVTAVSSRYHQTMHVYSSL